MFPEVRLRRLRQNDSIRKMLDIPLPGPEKMIWPIFVVAGKNIREPIPSMPGQYRLSIDQLLSDLKPVVQMGIGGILLFGQINEEQKDKIGSKAHSSSGVVQDSVRKIKEIYPNLLVATDVCMCSFTDHGHCGPLDKNGKINNDEALQILSKIACSMSEAGADIVAPSSMMDGQVKVIRSALDEMSFQDTIIMSYSSKFASSMYGPFRDAQLSTPQNGDRKNYQTSYANPLLALRESESDEDEGADILMIKPALFYLDILSKMRESTNLPIAAYNVSGEYAMIHASAEKGWGNLKDMAKESTLSITRAGADIIISYWANQYEHIFKS